VPNTGPVSGRRQAGPVDDRRVGLIIRALRRRRGWRQSDLAVAAKVSQSSVSLVERGHLDTLSLRRIRLILAALDARGEFDLRWRGGGLDRLLDEGHARLAGQAVAVLTPSGWASAVEVTYSIFGERGSIDLLAFHPASRSLLVIEVKTELTSIEETLRRLDQKVRLGSRIALERFGWAASGTSALLILPDRPAARRSVLRHEAVLDAALPTRTVAVRQWLRAPIATIRGCWFLANTRPGGIGSNLGGPNRVYREPASTARQFQARNRDPGR
jgi:transcriptional regulator with XRE-family HTH domain